jgi:uncharacterized ubiquitin-like protein YukD
MLPLQSDKSSGQVKDDGTAILIAAYHAYDLTLSDPLPVMTVSVKMRREEEEVSIQRRRREENKQENREELVVVV